jgi:ASC-1-like (ASCH) protein
LKRGIEPAEQEFSAENSCELVPRQNASGGEHLSRGAIPLEGTMKKHILRFRAKDKRNFLELKAGLKSVETRAATERYRKIAKGDILVITCGKLRLEKKVKRARIFKSIDSLTMKIPYRKIMPSALSLSDVKKAYAGYPGYTEKLKKFGVVAWDL